MLASSFLCLGKSPTTGGLHTLVWRVRASSTKLHRHIRQSVVLFESMKPRSLILIALIMIVPLGALTWAIVRIAASDKVVVQQQFRDLLIDRLQDVNGNISAFFESTERDLVRVTTIDQYAIDQLRQVNRTEPQLQQLFVLTAAGALAFPDPTESASPLSLSERSFLFDAAKMFIDQDLRDKVLRAEQDIDASNIAAEAAPNSTVQNATNQRGWSQQTAAANSPQQQKEISQQVQEAYGQNSIQSQVKFEGSSGWFNWYWDRGVNLIYWQRRPSGHIVGAALERARWIADLIGQLPDTVDSESRALDTRVRLVNASGDSVYQWGSFEPGDDADSFCEIPVTYPLESWRLQCFVSTQKLASGTGRSAWLSLLALLVAVAAVLGVCGFLFVREYARDMQEATQQVSFVNQVSHELKTPLTNIRMYAELLDHDLDVVASVDAKKPRERLGVILSEGQRLSRLIGNVLTFARQNRKTLQVQARPEPPCRLIHQITDRFRPAFADQQIDVQLTCDDQRTMQIDADFVEQIVGNLISNVEKYAANGGLLQIDCTINQDMLTIDVRDHGSGIAAAKKEEVFKPFARVSNEVSYAAGTGIGLSIARELARLHGGDLVLMDSNNGCWFQATVRNQE